MKSLTGKIFRETLVVTVCALLAASLISLLLMYGYFESDYTEEIENEAKIIASAMEDGGDDILQELNLRNLRVTYVTEDGDVIFDNWADSKSMENHAEREEIVQARKSGSGKSIRYSETLRERTYYYAQRLKNGSILRIAASRDTIWGMTIGLFHYLILAALAAVILSTFLSRHISQKLLKPINQIDLDNPEKAEIYDEFTPLLLKVIKQNKKISEQMGTLERERREFSAITENMREGFAMIDKDSIILLSNKAAQNLMGTSKIGKSVFRLNHKEEFIESVEKALGGEPASEIIEVNSRFINMAANPVYAQGELVGAVLLLTDVTEKEEWDSLRRTFSANVSHELKTPLTSISCTAEMIKSGMIPPKDITHFADNIYNEAQRLIELVGDIIKLSRLDENSFSQSFEFVDATELVLHAVNAIKNSADAKNIKIIEDIEDVQMNCVPPVFEEIAYNLLDNAVKYTPENGKVNISFKKEGEKILLKVKDNGIGIAKVEQERIFERFYRVDKGRSKDTGGTGLGLSIVKHGATVHNATLSLNSEIGKGSEFIITF